MGLQTRPDILDVPTYNQARIYEANHIKWINFYGYVTNIKELAAIFDMPHMTLVKRLKAGWPIESALTADPKQQWTINNVQFFQSSISNADITKVLETFFVPKSSKKKSGKNRVMDGGTF